MTRFRTGTLLLSLTLLGGTMTARAEPWIDTSNLALRTEIQYLADHGLIKAPVNTWPLMWAAIEGDLRAVDASQLDATGLNAWQDVMRHLNFSQKSVSSASLSLSPGSCSRAMPSQAVRMLRPRQPVSPAVC